MPPHSFLFGHLLVIASVVRSLPPHAHGVYFGHIIRQRYPHFQDGFHLDLWPVAPLLLVVYNPTMLRQLEQERPLPKHETLRCFLRPLTGEEDMVTLEGASWKRWRNIFNPGFSANHITNLVPTLVEEHSKFRDSFRRHAEEVDMFFLEKETLATTIDIIGRVAM